MNIEINEEVRYENARAKESMVDKAKEILKSADRIQEELERLKEVAKQVIETPDDAKHFPSSIHGMQIWNELPSDIITMGERIVAYRNLKRVTELLLNENCE